MRRCKLHHGVIAHSVPTTRREREGGREEGSLWENHNLRGNRFLHCLLALSKQIQVHADVAA